MKNIDILGGVLTEWAKPMIDDIAKSIIGNNQSISTVDAWIKKYFPVSENYSIWNDLSFLAMPVVNMAITPMLSAGISKLGIADEDIPRYAHEVVDKMVIEAEKKGGIMFLERYKFSTEEMKNLKTLLNENLKIE
jgi:hypothetical protein